MHARARIFMGIAVAGFVAAPTYAGDEPSAKPNFHKVQRQGKNSPAVAPLPPQGFTPAQILGAYGFPAVVPLSNDGAGQTIAIVDAYNQPNITSDLAVFSAQFHLPAPTAANFQVVKMGNVPNDVGWGQEISIDVEWAHAIAPGAKIILVEAPSSSFIDLFNAVDRAVSLGATVVSMSWAGSEFGPTAGTTGKHGKPGQPGETSYDTTFMVAGVSFLAAAGDSGAGALYPSVSPFVTSVGGTTLTLSSGGYGSETAWADSGGGISAYEAAPAYQSGWLQSGWVPMRATPDVAWDADPNTGVAVYDSYGAPRTGGWSYEFGGTSIGSPQWAGLVAIVNQQRVALGKGVLGSTGAPSLNQALYAAALTATPDVISFDYHDTTTGHDGPASIDFAVPGYDLVTGLGTPSAAALIGALAAQ